MRTAALGGLIAFLAPGTGRAHIIPRDPAQLAATVMVAEIGETEIRLTYEISPADFATYGGLVPEQARAQLPAGTSLAGTTEIPAARVST